MDNSTFTNQNLSRLLNVVEDCCSLVNDIK